MADGNVAESAVDAASSKPGGTADDKSAKQQQKANGEHHVEAGVEAQEADGGDDEVVDHDSLIPVTGSLAGEEAGEEEGEEEEEEEEGDEDDYSNVVQGTTETLLTKLEENLAAGGGGGGGGGGSAATTATLQETEPADLEEEGKDIEQVLSIISNSIYREGEGQIFSKLCDRSSLLSIVSHSLSAYITTLDAAPLQRLSNRIAGEVSQWLSRLFHFPGGLAHCHDSIREGLVRTVQMVLHHSYPDLQEEGFAALASSPPVIYITTTTYLEVATYICIQLGLPKSTVRLVSPQDEEDNFQSFRAALAADREQGRRPLFCLANVHSTLFHRQNVTALQALCQAEQVWLHLEGHAVSGLVLLPTEGYQETQFDSLTLTFGSWVGIPAVPFVTLYRGDVPAAQLAGLGLVTPSVRLSCLPLWCVLKSLGLGQLKARIRAVYQMLEDINGKLSSMKCLRVLSQSAGGGASSSAAPAAPVTAADLEAGSVEPARIFNTVSPAIAFQYVSETPPADLSVRVPAYTDNLNSWLGQILQRDAPQIMVEIVDVETTGYVLRLCPFEDVSMVGLMPEEVTAFLQCLEEKCDILNATVTQRSKFLDLIQQEPCVEHVDIAHWAGLGGVRFIPQDFIRKADEGSSSDEASTTVPGVDDDDEASRLINQRNMELVATLRNTDSAFSLGEGPPPHNHMCVRFGMVTMETDVEELLSLVITTGRDIDEAVAQLQTMSEVVKKGVQQAQDELRKEAENQLWQEGILRHVPIVGSFYNWLSPVPEEAKVKGRYLNLQEGKLETTEKIYKHHMQIHIEDGQEL